MTTQTAIVPNKAKVQLPAQYQEELAAEALELAKRLAAPSGDTIRCGGKVFILPDGTETPELDVVIVDFVSANKFYPGEYDEKNVQPPVCYALGVNLDDMRPSPKSTDPQAKDCKTCWANQWKSDAKKRGKACKNERLLGVLAPDMQAEGPLLVVKVAPMGSTPFDTHAKSATALHGGLLNVRTKITFDDKVKYDKLQFATDTPNDDPGAAFSRRKEARARLLTEPDYGAAAAKKADAAKTKKGS